MIRIGGYAIPDMTLADAATVVQQAHRAFGPSFSREALAGVLGLNSRGGWFAAVIASLRLWRLAEGRGTFRLTAGGLRLARAEPGEKLDAAMIEATEAVPLLKEIRGRSPDSAPRRTDLALMLAEITGADAGRIHSALPQVQRLLADAFPGDRDRRPGRTSESSDSPSLSQPRPDSTRPAGLELSFSGGRLSLPETPENLELAADLLRRRVDEMRGPVSG